VFWRLHHQHDDRDTLVVDDDRVVITRRRSGREQQHEFQTHWARIVVEQDGSGWYPAHVYLTSHGRRVEIGNQLSSEQRLDLAEKLRPMVGRGYL
jgi:uncharacterized membrane protein